MSYSVHCSQEPPALFEDREAARADYQRRQEAIIRGPWFGWTGILKDGQPESYWPANANEVWAMCREQLREDGQ